MLQHIIKHSAKEAIRAAETLQTKQALAFMEALAQMLALCFKHGGKLLIAGNGGSLCDAMHFAEELTGYFRGKRRALPALALSDPGHMSCVGNDAGFETVFARGVEAHGKQDDILVLLTTSGNSANLVMAAQRAHDMGIKTAAFLGKGGGLLKGVCHLEWIVDGFTTSDRVQEAHMAAIHIIIEGIESLLFAKDLEAAYVH